VLFLRNLLQFLVTANVVPSSLILSTLIMGAIYSSETSELTRTTRRHIPGESILLLIVQSIKAVLFNAPKRLYLYLYFLT
jgi:hypothetical protein